MNVQDSPVFIADHKDGIFFSVLMRMTTFPLPVLAWFALIQLGAMFILDHELTSKILVVTASTLTLLIAVVRVVADWYKDRRHARQIAFLEAENADTNRRLEESSLHREFLQQENETLWKSFGVYQSERQAFREEIRSRVRKIERKHE